MADSSTNPNSLVDAEMVEVLTWELDGPALDWVVAKCEELLGPDGRLTDEYCDSLSHDSDGGFSTDWGQAGPIIEREWAAISRARLAFAIMHRDDGKAWDDDGVLVGLLRCFAMSRLGDTVEVPRELVQRVAPLETAASDSFHAEADESPTRERNRG